MIRPAGMTPVQRLMPDAPSEDSRPTPRGAAYLSPFRENAVAFGPKPRTLARNRIIAWNKRDPRTPAFDVLRTKLIAAMKSNGWNTLAVTSPTEGCGKTTVAVNLAMSFGHQMPSRVLLLDLDLRRPQVAKTLGLDTKVGIGSYLEGETPLTVYDIRVNGSEMRVVPGQGSRPNATELLATPRLDKLVASIREDGTDCLAILDLPPVLSGDDAISILPRIDCALMIAGEGLTRKSDISEALSLMIGTEVLGVVMNRSRRAASTYYY